MLKFLNIGTAFLCTLGVLFVSMNSAQAGRYKLKCQGQYQLVDGSLISTPPCQEAYIAKVARSYGYKVSARQIRKNPNKKVSLCQRLGHDIRISNICGAYNLNAGGIAH